MDQETRTIAVSSDVLQSLRQHAAVSIHVEVCGLLFGYSSVLHSFAFAKNVAQNPTVEFEIDPAFLIAAHRSMRNGGPNIIGCFHSHPSGAVQPSLVDAHNAEPDGQIWMIIAGSEVTAWQAVERGQLHGRFNPVVILPC